MVVFIDVTLGRTPLRDAFPAVLGRGATLEQLTVSGEPAILGTTDSGGNPVDVG